MRIETISRLAVLAAVAVAAGCAQPVSTREVALNADAYTARALSPDALPASVRARLPAAGTQPMGFRTLRLTGTQRVVGMGNVAVDSEYELTFHNDRDDGTLRSIYIGRFNGLPVNYVLALNYHLSLIHISDEGAAGGGDARDRHRAAGLAAPQRVEFATDRLDVCPGLGVGGGLGQPGVPGSAVLLGDARVGQRCVPLGRLLEMIDSHAGHASLDVVVGRGLGRGVAGQHGQAFNPASIRAHCSMAWAMYFLTMRSDTPSVAAISR